MDYTFTHQTGVSTAIAIFRPYIWFPHAAYGSAQRIRVVLRGVLNAEGAQVMEFVLVFDKRSSCKHNVMTKTRLVPCHACRSKYFLVLYRCHSGANRIVWTRGSAGYPRDSGK
jgi:hypothetical protein